MDIDKERELFEIHFKCRGAARIEINPDEYLSFTMQERWIAWQARAQLSPAPSEHVDTYRLDFLIKIGPGVMHTLKGLRILWGESTDLPLRDSINAVRAQEKA